MLGNDIANNSHKETFNNAAGAALAANLDGHLKTRSMEEDDKSFEKLLLFCFFFAVAFVLYLCVCSFPSLDGPLGLLPPLLTRAD